MENDRTRLDLKTDLCPYAEVQQRLVDRTSGEGGLRGGLHPQPGQTGEHPSAAGAEDETEPTQLQVTGRSDPIHPPGSVNFPR